MEIRLFINNIIKKNKKKLSRKDRRKCKKNANLNLKNDFLSSRYLLSMIRQKKKFCISHKDNISVVVSAKVKCGIDVEKLKERDFYSLSSIFSNDEECKWIENKKLNFYMVFCAKEAIIKLFSLNFSNLKDIKMFKVRKDEILFTYNKKVVKCVYYVFDNYIICIALRSFYEC